MSDYSVFAQIDGRLDLKKVDALSVHPLSLPAVKGLSAQTKRLDDGTIASDVAVIQVIEQGTALSYQFGQ